MMRYSMECILGIIIYGVMCTVIEHLSTILVPPLPFLNPQTLMPGSGAPPVQIPTSQILTHLAMLLLVGAVTNALLTSPLTGGMRSIALRAAWGQKPDLSQLFSGFRNYARWVAVAFLRMGLNLFTMSPFWIACWLSLPYLKHFADTSIYASNAIDLLRAAGPAIPIMLVGLLLWAAIGTAFLARWYFVEFLMVEGMPVLDAFEHSATMTQGIRVQVIAYSFAVFIFGMVISMLTCSLGMILFAPIAFYGRAAMYAEVRYQLAGMRPGAPSYHY